METMKTSVCGWCRYMDNNICTKYNKVIKLVEVKHFMGNHMFNLPSAIRCNECLEEEENLQKLIEM